MNNIVIVDIDGVIANGSHRAQYIKDPKEYYSRVGQDAPIPHMVEVVRRLSLANTTVAFITARPETARQDTYEWLTKHMGRMFKDAPLYMPVDSTVPEVQFKESIFKAEFQKVKSRIIAVIDDDPDCAAMWKKHGLPVLSV